MSAVGGYRHHDGGIEGDEGREGGRRRGEERRRGDGGDGMDRLVVD